jgi:hypothetical protein
VGAPRLWPQAEGRPALHLNPTELKSCAAPLTPAEIWRERQSFAASALAQLHLEMMHGANDRDRIKAANAILDRAYGRPSKDTGIDMALSLFGQEFLTTRHGRITERARQITPYAVETLKRSPNADVWCARMSRDTCNVGVHNGFAEATRCLAIFSWACSASIALRGMRETGRPA